MAKGVKYRRNSLTRRQFTQLAGWGTIGILSYFFARKSRSSDWLGLANLTTSSYPNVPSGQSLLVSHSEVITVNSTGLEITRQTRQAKYLVIDLGNNSVLEMIAIPSGKFFMGSSSEELGYEYRESPRHSVAISPFYISKYPITQAQWTTVMGDNPSFHMGIGPNLPVNLVSWYDCLNFCQRLSEITRLKFRLPSESEWEYACRAGTTTPFYFGETITGILANYYSYNTYADEAPVAARGNITEVGIFPPNAFGLHDMHGNVAEWCLDIYHDSYNGAPNNNSPRERGNNVEQNNLRVLRGGSYSDKPWQCRSAYRTGGSPRVTAASIGFRVVLSTGETG